MGSSAQFMVLLAISATLAAPAVAQDLTLNDGAVHTISPTITGTLRISNNTTVNLIGGSIGASGIDSVTVRDTSVFNMSGGSTTGGRIAALDNSVVNLTGGVLGHDPGFEDSIVTFGNPMVTVFNINASGSAAAGGGTITIHGGSFSGSASDGRAAFTFSTGTMEISGGSFNGSVSGHSSAGITVHGGSIGKNTDGSSIVVFAGSQIQVLGGTFAGGVMARDDGHLIVCGGTIGIDNFTNSVLGRGCAMIEVRGGVFSGRIGAFETSVIDVFGCPLAIDASGVLTGLLEDGTPVSVQTVGSIQLFGCTLNDAVTGLADFVASLDLSLFDGHSGRVRRGRRSTIAGWIRSAAHKIAMGQNAAASALLTNVQQRVDGDPTPRDWMLASAERDSVHTVIVALLVLLGP